MATIGLYLAGGSRVKLEHFMRDNLYNTSRMMYRIQGIVRRSCDLRNFELCRRYITSQFERHVNRGEFRRYGLALSRGRATYLTFHFEASVFRSTAAAATFSDLADTRYPGCS